MQTSKTCTFHESKQISIICVSQSCQLVRMGCQDCKQNHKNHQFMTFSAFSSKYGRFFDKVMNATNIIKKSFQKLNTTYSMCIRKAEERILRLLIPFSGAISPNLAQLQSQIVEGMAHDICSNQLLFHFFTNDDPKQKSNVLLNNLQAFDVYIQELGTNMMASINKLVSQTQIAKISQSKQFQSIQIPKEIQKFAFIQSNKPKNYEILDNGNIIKRIGNLNNGFTMYAVVNKPLTPDCNTIKFKLIQQQKRFIYFGVCDLETFKKFDLRGPLYQIGNKMYAIRQASQNGKNAITLHNSLENFSNQSIVPWDFEVGDTITIQYTETKNCVIFRKNDKNTFELPLDKETKKFYPFVGLKFQNDAVKII